MDLANEMAHTNLSAARDFIVKKKVISFKSLAINTKSLLEMSGLSHSQFSMKGLPKSESWEPNGAREQRKWIPLMIRGLFWESEWSKDRMRYQENYLKISKISQKTTWEIERRFNHVDGIHGLKGFFPPWESQRQKGWHEIVDTEQREMRHQRGKKGAVKMHSMTKNRRT